MCRVGKPVSVVFGSCFLLAMQEDSIEGIYDTLKQCALISKNAGGVGLHVHCIRASGSFIAGVSMPCTTFFVLLFIAFAVVYVCCCLDPSLDRAHFISGLEL